MPAHIEAPDLYLASQSPRRRELLQQIAVRHEVISVSVQEVSHEGETPSDYVTRLACEKSAAGWRALIANGLAARPVLGADTIGDLDGHILEKPRDKQDAIEMLTSMSGRMHTVLSAVALTCSHGQQQRLSETRVHFGQINRSEIERYWDTGEPVDKAGGYAIQGLGSIFVERIEGSYSGVVGLPIHQLVSLLNWAGVPYWRTELANTESWNRS